MTVTQYFAGPDDSLVWSRFHFDNVLSTRRGGFGRWCAWWRRGLPSTQVVRRFGVDLASSLADLPRLPLLDRSQLVRESDQFLVYPGS